MKDAIFLLQTDNSLTRMTAERYESEALLQQLLADYPDLLAGGQLDRDEPRRWILVRREMGVPSEVGGGAQWSIDHLFIDQDAIPTIVEVKRASDTRIRREVVGQMLDYAANGVRYWPIDALRTEFAAHCAERGVNPDVALLEQLGVEEPDEFWKKVRENLEVGHVRLVFVADAIPLQLQRIIEFLNDQMQRSQVIGLQVQQYVSKSGLRTLVPRVVGDTAQSRITKGGSRNASYAEVLAAAPQDAQLVERRLLEWAEREGHRTSTVRTARRFETADGGRLFLLYPGANYVEFRLGTLYDVGMTVGADDVISTLTRYAGSPRTGRQPSLKCDALLRVWEEFRSVFLPKYVALRQEALARKQDVGE